MKTYCKPKTVNIESAGFNSPAVHKAFGQGKLAKNEFAKLLVRTGLITFEEINRERQEQRLHKIPEAIEAVNVALTERIRQRDLQLKPIKQFPRRDGITQKMRTLSKLSPEQQIFEYIAVGALQPLFHAKLLPYQYGSIPGRGQALGKRRIERLLRRKFHSQPVDEVKCDIHHAYESVTVECVMRLLRRDIGKNKPLLWLLAACMANYPKKALVIGGYLPTWLFNYVMSYVLRYLMGLKKVRRGVARKMVAACVCYADDFSLYGRISNLRRAINQSSRWSEKTLGLSVKKAWSVTYVSSLEEEKAMHEKRRQGSHMRTQGIDMMGFVVYRTYTIIRGGVFVRVRRQLIRAKRDMARLGYMPYWRAYPLIAYNGWLQHSNSSKFKSEYSARQIIKAARRAVSRHSKNRMKEGVSHDYQAVVYAGA